MDITKTTQRILKIVNDSPYARIDMDSAEAGEIWKILNKELNQGQKLPIHNNVIVPKGTFNCLGGNFAKGIKPCDEWCGEDMCQKPSN